MEIEYDNSILVGNLIPGRVYTLVSLIYSGRISTKVIVKKLEKTRVNKVGEEQLALLDHLNVVKLICCQDDISGEFRLFAFEFYDASMDQFFLKDDTDPKKYKGPIPSVDNALIQLAEGLDYIHSQKLVHGDIQPKSVVISSSTSSRESPVLKWSDFNLKDSSDEEITTDENDQPGQTWKAPELRYDEGKLLYLPQECKESDIYSYGLVSYYFTTKGKHFNDAAQTSGNKSIS